LQRDRKGGVTCKVGIVDYSVSVKEVRAVGKNGGAEVGKEKKVSNKRIIEEQNL
jgi:hypothetical protein